MHRVHVDRASYKSWIYEHCTSYAVRWARLDDYDRFVDRWPLLQDWFKAPLRQRLLDKENCVRGEHPHGGASPFDKRISEHLGVTAFEIYQVELPPGESTEPHTHLDDQVEDVYVVTRGDGWLVVDDEHVPITAGQFIAVTVESVRAVLAGESGVVLVAICAPT